MLAKETAAADQIYEEKQRRNLRNYSFCINLFCMPTSLVVVYVVSDIYSTKYTSRWYDSFQPNVPHNTVIKIQCNRKHKINASTEVNNKMKIQNKNNRNGNQTTESMLFQPKTIQKRTKMCTIATNDDDGSGGGGDNKKKTIHIQYFYCVYIFIEHITTTSS